MVQVIEPWNFRSSSFSTEGATYNPRTAITLGIGRHSSVKCVLFAAVASKYVNEYIQGNVAEHIQPPAPLVRMTRLKSSLGARIRLRQNVTRTMQQGC